MEEMADLRSFVIARLREIIGSDDHSRILSPYDEESARIRMLPLFEQVGQPGELIPDKSLFDPIVDALIQVTHDSSIHFHLLRKGGLNLRFPLI